MREGSNRAALFGVAHVVLLFAGSAAVAQTSGPGRHSLHASAEDVAAYVADASLARVWAGEYLAVLAYLLFLPFAAAVWAALRGAPDWLRATTRSTATAFVVLSVAGIAVLLPALNRGLEPLATGALLDLRTALLGLALVFLAGWLVASGSAALSTRALPAWLGWSAIAIGLLQLAATPFAAFADELTGLPTFAGFLWVAVTSVLLARRRAPAPA